MSKDIRVKIIGDDSSFQAAMKRANLSAEKTGASFTQMGKHIAGGLAAFAGVSIGVGLIEESVKAAEHAQVAHELLAQQMKNVGLSFKNNAPEIEHFTESLSKMSGFTATELTVGFTNLVRVTKNVGKAQDDLRIAVDLARLKHIDLESATALVTKAQIGLVGGLRRAGIDVVKVTTNVDALRAAHDRAAVAAKAHGQTIEKISKQQLDEAKAADKAATATAALAKLHSASAGSAEAYGHTAAGAMDRFRAAIEKLQVEAGSKLLPTLALVTEKALKFVDNWNKAGTTANDVHKDLDLLAGAFRGLGDAADYAAKKLGGWSKVAKIAKGIFEQMTGIQSFKTINSLANSAFGGNGGGSAASGGTPGGLAAFVGNASNIGGPGGMVQGHTGMITSGLSALEHATGGQVTDDYANHGHADHSFHYKGQAVDLAPDPKVWAMLFARKTMFAELLGPWGLYNWGIQFYDAKLQSEHMNHIHVAFTGGSDAIKKAFGGGGGASTISAASSSATTTSTPTFSTTAKKVSTHSLSGAKLLSKSTQKALAKAAGTTSTADDLTALDAAKAELLKLPQTVAVATELSNVEKRIHQIQQANLKAHLKIQTAEYRKHAAEVAASLKAQESAWKDHLKVLQDAAARAKAVFDRSFGEAANELFKQFDRQTAMGLSNLVVAQTPEEKAYADFVANRAAADQAKSRADQLANAATPEEAAQLALGFSLDDQQTALQAAADASRVAQNKATADAQQRYQDMRDADRQALQDWLDDQKQALDDGRVKWDKFYADLKAKAAQGGFDIGQAFWDAWNAAQAANASATQAGNQAASAASGPSGDVGGFYQVIQQMLAAGTMTTAQAALYKSGHKLEIPQFGDGGVVPGVGPQLAVVHGGETIIPNGAGGDVYLTTTVMLPDGSVLGKTVQRWAKQDLMRGGAGVPG